MAGRDWKVVVKTLATPVNRVRRIDVAVGVAPEDFTQNMENLTILSGFLEQPSVQTTGSDPEKLLKHRFYIIRVVSGGSHFCAFRCG